MAQDPSAVRRRKIGLSHEYPGGFAKLIFKDIRQKLPALDKWGISIAGIGPGCPELPLLLADHCRRRGHLLTWIDAVEVLAHLPDARFVHKLTKRFIIGSQALKHRAAAFDVVIAYSVSQYSMPGADIFTFLDAAVALLAPGGAFLLGGVPNISARKRNTASDSGKRFDQQCAGGRTGSPVALDVLNNSRIDDSAIVSLLMRARAAGFEAYVLPQDHRLPTAHCCEDILIMRWEAPFRTLN